MRTRTLAFAVTAALAGFLTLAPTNVAPVAWQAPEAPQQTHGPFAHNDRLRGITRLGAGQLHGPEALVVDAQGRVLTGLEDGRVVRLDPVSGAHETLTQTDGRPLGLAQHPDGRLIIADARRGLLALSPAGHLDTLVGAPGPARLGFVDDVVVSADGRYAWFSDATAKWRYGQDAEAILEHGGDGRLLRHDFRTGLTAVMLDGLQFANGVALGPDEAFVLVNETGAYRVTRLWLKGPKAGQRDTFVDNLPGLPDNITFNGRDRFWLALYAPRNPLLDAVDQWPGLRRAFARVLAYLPKPVEHRAMVVGLNREGDVTDFLEDRAGGNYSPITTARQAGGWLYLGSLAQDSLARLPVKPAP